jgi:hypothetical protein
MVPNKREIFPVFSLIVFVVYTWTIYRMAWQMQSWLYFMTINQVLILAAYILADALIESILVLGFVLFLAMIFPSRFLKCRFAVQGSALVIFMTLGAVLLQNRQDMLSNLPLAGLVLFPLVVLVGLFLFLVLFYSLAKRKGTVSRLMLAIADRFTLFSFIYVPLSLIGLTVVIIRNLF